MHTPSREVRKRLDIHEKIEDLKAKVEELDERIEGKKKVLSGLETEFGERIVSLELGVMAVILAILGDEDIKSQLSRMLMWGYGLHDVQSLYRKITEWIRKSQEQLVGQAAEVEEVSA